MEIIQITEEQARDMYFCLCGSVGGVETRIKDLRKKGYIKQSALEKAKLQYYAYRGEASSLTNLENVSELYVKELEKALEEK